MITALYASLLGLMLVALSANAILARRSFRIAIGDRDEMGLKRVIRAQQNFAEYAPFYVLLSAMAELGGTSTWAIHAGGALFLVGRVMHAYSLLRHETYDGIHLTHNPAWRIRGMVCTLTAISVVSLTLMLQYIELVGR